MSAEPVKGASMTVQVWRYNRNGDELNAWVKGPAWNDFKFGFEDETETDMEMVEGKI